MKYPTITLLTMLVLGSCGEERKFNVLSIYPDKDNLLNDISLEDISSLESCRQIASQFISEAGYKNADYECGMSCKRANDSTGKYYICKETLR